MVTFIMSVKRWKVLSGEGKMCSLVLLCVAIYSLLHVFGESVEHEGTDERSSKRFLGEGWSAMSRKKDIADFEWTLWFSESRFVLLAMYVCHSLCTIGCGYLEFNNEVGNSVLFSHDFMWIYTLLGWKFVAAVALCSAIFYVVSTLKRELYVWSLGAILLISMHFSPYMQVLYSASINSYAILAHSAMLLGVFRCCSFGFEHCRKTSTGTLDTFFSLIRYSFYLPYFFFGPVMTYDVFSKQKPSFNKSETVVHFLKDVARVGVYVMCVDFLLHFFHVSSLPLDQSFMKNSPSVVVGFLAFANVFLDWMKGRVLYALSSGVAGHVDGYNEAPRGCKNISRIFTFADTYFDRGIQHWLCRYVYNPVGNGHTNITKEAIAGGLSFMVVVFLQGLGLNTLLWAFLNWVGLTVEFIISQQNSGIQNKIPKTLLLGMNYWCILLFNSIAINGLEAFQLYFTQIFINGGYIGILSACVLGYCYVSLNTEINQVDKNVKVE